MVIYKQLHRVKGPFQNDFKIQLMILKPVRNNPNFEITHYYFDISPTLS